MSAITVLELEGALGKPLTCHYEVILNVVSVASDSIIDGLILSDSQLFNNSVVKRAETG